MENEAVEVVCVVCGSPYVARVEDGLTLNHVCDACHEGGASDEEGEPTDLFVD